MSHIVIVDTTKGRGLPFEQLTGVCKSCVESYADEPCELFNLEQFGYHPEYGATTFEIVIDWGRIPAPEPKRVGLGEVIEPSEMAVALKRLEKLYSQAIGGDIQTVRHEGQITRCVFKQKEPYLESPINLDWYHLPLATEVTEEPVKEE